MAKKEDMFDDGRLQTVEENSTFDNLRKDEVAEYQEKYRNINRTISATVGLTNPVAGAIMYITGENKLSDENVYKEYYIPQNEQELRDLANEINVYETKNELQNRYENAAAGIDTQSSVPVCNENSLEADTSNMEAETQCIYVVRGAKMHCNCGSHIRMLNLPRSHGVYINDHPMVHQLDCIVGDNYNISTFGVCQSAEGQPDTPTVLLALEEYDENLNSIGTLDENIKGPACSPAIIGGWQDTYRDTRIVDNGDKDPSDKAKNANDLSKGYPATTTLSYLVCKYGGIIHLYSSGQEYEEEDDRVLPKMNINNLEDLEKCISAYEEVLKEAMEGENINLEYIDKIINEMAETIAQSPFIRNNKNNVLQWIQMVNTNQPMDLKNRNGDDNIWIRISTFHGKEIPPDYIGNWLYGYVGASMFTKTAGVDDDNILKYGAGVAQIFSDALHGINPIDKLFDGKYTQYLDNDGDSEMIQDGIDDYDRIHSNK